MMVRVTDLTCLLMMRVTLLFSSMRVIIRSNFFLKDGTIPDPRSTDNVEFRIVQTITNHKLEGKETDKWNTIVNTFMEFSEETFTEVHHLYNMEKTSTNHQK